MKILLTVIFGVLITSTYGGVSVISKSPNETMLKNTTKFEIQINETVNAPLFPAFVRFYESTSNESVCDVNTENNPQVVYNKTVITFYTQNCSAWLTNRTYHIAFDDGVFYSGNTSNSTAETNQTFWSLKVNEDPSTTLTTIPTTMTTDIESTRAFARGEPPPTRSAKLGMGLGIVLIAILLIGEIMYFQCMYRGGLRNKHYNGQMLS